MSQSRGGGEGMLYIRVSLRYRLFHANPLSNKGCDGRGHGAARTMRMAGDDPFAAQGEGRMSLGSKNVGDDPAAAMAAFEKHGLATELQKIDRRLLHILLVLDPVAEQQFG